MQFDEAFWEHYRSLVPIRTDPERSTEAWRLREQVILNYIYLTKRIVAKVKKTIPAHVEADDLESWANIGLLQAVQRYDHTLGVPFEAYCTQRAKSVIMDGIRDADWAPRSLRKKQRDITRITEQVRQKDGRDPTNDEIAEALDITSEEVANTKYKADIATHAYIDANPEAQNKPSSLDDDEDELIQLLKTVASKSLSNMSAKKAAIIALHYYAQLNLSSIAKLLRTSEVNVGKLHAEAVMEIWDQLESAAHANDE